MVLMNLLPIPRDGEVGSHITLSDTTRAVISNTVKVYEQRGYVEPWIGYLAVEEGVCVGCGGFTAPPVDGVVEIAYFTFPGFEGRGIATGMVRRLVALAGEKDSAVSVVAHTLAEENASNHILKKVGFVFAGTVNHPEDGDIWKWRYAG